MDSSRSEVFDSDKQPSRYRMNTYLDVPEDKTGKFYLLFTLKERISELIASLKVFEAHGINIVHIESRPSRSHAGCYEFLIECNAMDKQVKSVFKTLQDMAENVTIQTFGPIHECNDVVPWFPKKIKDLDLFADRVLTYGSELDADHPGFKDEVYRKRRQLFADIAHNYRHGQPIPRIEYTKEETETWGVIYKELKKLYPTHACREFNHIFPLLEQNCGYSEKSIPQLQDVSDFLKECTGFTVRPVAGLLSSRDFLAGLAFRVFHTTQYIRHSSAPKYTPEPDVCHELLGHVPLFADPNFAQFSQEIGLSSLGAPDEVIQKLATVNSFFLFFTPQTAPCTVLNFHSTVVLVHSGIWTLRTRRQTKSIRSRITVFIWGIAGSIFIHTNYCLTDEPEVHPFNPEITATTEYPITSYQPKYFLAQSFENAKEQLIKWASAISRPFNIRYDPYTQRIQILDNTEILNHVVHDVRNDLQLVESTLMKLST
ncbi:putative phenylalanine-4-hydroxylase 1 [Trichinella pseudospiralis]|uniref:phenylalanine 4-monooxygenase n=1 Tax=Trichinella pseudospiralis TaxID=6337 RepID=A0A0V0XFN8_TRIPS|nr:putative phenylalanine-4-hydroxylase 1 [Trichinella pseudospiralis]